MFDDDTRGPDRRVNHTSLALFPVIAGFAAGYLLRRTGSANSSDGQFLLLLNLLVCMPALMLRAVSRVPLDMELLVFPLSALLMVSAGRLIGGFTVRRMHLEQQGAILVMSFMVVNSAFALPFVEAIYGAAGVARLAAFDVVNNALVMTWVYAIAARAHPDGGERGGRWLGFVLRTPPIYAVLTGLLLNTTGTGVPAIAGGVVDVFAAASPLVISVGTGILLVSQHQAARRAVAVSMTRPVVGLCLTALLAVVLGLDGVDLGVLLLLGAAPVGFVVVTFASLERLDAELAAKCLTLSLLVSLALSTGLAFVLA